MFRVPTESVCVPQSERTSKSALAKWLRSMCTNCFSPAHSSTYQTNTLNLGLLSCGDQERISRGGAQILPLSICKHSCANLLGVLKTRGKYPSGDKDGLGFYHGLKYSNITHLLFFPCHWTRRLMDLCLGFGDKSCKCRSFRSDENGWKPTHPGRSAVLQGRWRS